MNAAPLVRPDSMFLVLPVPFRKAGTDLYVEAQAANGLDRWADHFETVTVAAPVLPESRVPDMAGVVWKHVRTLAHTDRIHFQPLPWAYTPGAFLRALPRTRRNLRASMQQAQYLQFAIGGLWGDWAAVAALEARRQGRNYAIHTDRVEHELMRKTTVNASALRRRKIALEAPLVERFHREAIRHCSLGLWHGEDCFRAYSPWCRENHLIHDVHTRASDLIDADALARKCKSVRDEPVLRLCYAGRLDPMKAPLEWVQALAAARGHGAHFMATWFGEGPLREATEAEVKRLGLVDVVHFAGFVADRDTLLAEVKAAHAFIYTHVTPESPRNLLEALVCGTPILGYDNAYAVDLLGEQGGGCVVPLHDTEALGKLVAGLSRDREELVRLSLQAAGNGRRFTDAAVFAERSDLIKRFA